MVEPTCRTNGPRSVDDPSVWTGRALQAESAKWQCWSCSSVSGPLVERMLLAIMDIRAHPISFSDRPSKANRVTRSRMRRRDRSPISSNPTRRPRRVTPYDQRPKEQLKPSLRSHRRSLAPMGERRWRRRAPVIPLVNQSELISLLRGDAPRIHDVVRARSTRCGPACWLEL